MVPRRKRANIESFSPQGEQLDIRQAQVRFSAPMTALGRSDAPAPFIVDCDVAGNGYWSDERTWVYDLTQTPQAGACRFTETRTGHAGRRSGRCRRTLFLQRRRSAHPGQPARAWFDAGRRSGLRLAAERPGAVPTALPSMRVAKRRASMNSCPRSV
jgi:hypothetical protein